MQEGFGAQADPDHALVDGVVVWAESPPTEALTTPGPLRISTASSTAHGEENAQVGRRRLRSDRVPAEEEFQESSRCNPGPVEVDDSPSHDAGTRVHRERGTAVGHSDRLGAEEAVEVVVVVRIIVVVEQSSRRSRDGA